MSLERFAAGSPLSAHFPAPSDSDQWLPQDFADDLFGGTSELSQALSGSFVPEQNQHNNCVSFAVAITQ